jgi:hypothetical protein
MELTALTGGGAIADLRLRTRSPEVQENFLWEAPWLTLDPDVYKPSSHNRKYGPEFVGKFLACFTGHVLCLDYFGLPSVAEQKEGLCLHGEAAVGRWKIRRSQSRKSAAVLMETKLAKAGLTLHREMRMRCDETVVYVTETVFNQRSTDHYFHWVQHVTLGPPFLQAGESVVCVPAQRAITWPHGYEGRNLLANSKEFSWPNAPMEDGHCVDISKPFSHPGTGFVVGALLNSQRDWGFVAALNFRLGLLLGYCFHRETFPWVAIWEENCARHNPPWKGTTQARGMEFGTTPMPVGKCEAFSSGPLFARPTHCSIPAKGRLKTSYTIFVAQAGGDWRRIEDVQPRNQQICITGNTGDVVNIPARDLSTIMTFVERNVC